MRSILASKWLRTLGSKRAWWHQTSKTECEMQASTPTKPGKVGGRLGDGVSEQAQHDLACGLATHADVHEHLGELSVARWCPV